MEHHAGRAGAAAHVAHAPVPTAGHVLARAIPACLIAVLGIPLAAGSLFNDGTDRDMAWVLVLVTFLLMVLVHRFTRAPRPRMPEEVDRSQWRRALTAATRSGSVPSDRTVRTATGVVACTTLELFMMMVAVLLGALFGWFVRPDLPWLAATGASLGAALVYGFRLRSSWAYLRALHAVPRSD